MNLHEVNDGIQGNRKRKRIGRGPGSGHGKTSSRGHKGARSRASFKSHPAFEGGQMPLARRIPKRGFNNRWAKTVCVVNVVDLNDSFQDGDEVTLESLQSQNLAKGVFDILKILGDGELTKRLTVKAHRFSKSAEEKIKQAGGSTVVLPGPKKFVKQSKQEAAK